MYTLPWLRHFEGPISIDWLTSAILLLIAVKPEALPANVRVATAHPVGLVFLLLLGIALFSYSAILGTAIFIMVISIWRSTLQDRVLGNTTEGFSLSPAQLEYITSPKRWFVEEVLREHPIAIQEKQVRTEPIGDDGP